MNFSRKMILALATALLLVAGGVVYLSVPALQWRADVIALKLAGKIDDIELSELISMIRPGSGFWLQQLVDSRNPYSSIVNPYDSPQDIELGATVFEQNCAVCHGTAGAGGSAPTLARPTYQHGDSDWSLFRNVRDGIDGTAMPGNELDSRTLWSLVSYLRSLVSTTELLSGQTPLPLPDVTPAMLENSSDSPENWLTYSGTYSSQRYSQLAGITSENAKDVNVNWVYQFKGNYHIQESSPIVVSGIMYLTEAPNTVHALNAATGAELWTYVHNNDPDLKLCCGTVNRGLAIHGNTLFMGTLDSSLVALDAANGQLLWKTKLDDHRSGTSVTAAPLVVDNKVFVGYGGGDLGIRGFLDAVDGTSGEKAWRFYTIPEAGKPGNETWSGDSWKTGGAATWLTGSYDSDTRLLYWTTGNPAPDYQGDLRLGDNLFSNSVVALNVDTGELAWHFQFTPHDERDWDANQIPVLVDREWRGEQRRLLLLANRNAFFYVLDRDTGEFLLAEPFAKQNWAKGIDSSGRPVINVEALPTSKGTITWPGPIGATNWQSPTYSPKTGLFYVPTLEYGKIIFKDPEPIEYEIGEDYLGGWHRDIPGQDGLYYAVRAIDPETGKIVWEYKNPNREDWWHTGGLLSTAGNIVFGGDDTDIFILNATTGEELWRKNVGGRINAAPVTYEVGGMQYFAIAAGRSIFTVSLSDLADPDTRETAPDSALADFELAN